ncbi:MAG TPA: triose-phosphate isomerase [Candidatus Paceibacterota bacterium]
MNEELYIIANWKMNPQTLDEALALANRVKEGVANTQGSKVVLCPPFPFISYILPSEHVEMGAQNCFWEGKGAFTGEISPRMLKELGCTYVILGHSERAKYLGETQEMVRKKTKAALEAGLRVVLCVGENEETPADAENLIVVYEPEWAISSEGGDAADSKLVAARIAKMRETLKTTPILYGGSTNSKNIQTFLQAGAQGALVGSASLDAEEFISLVKNAVS